MHDCTSQIASNLGCHLQRGTSRLQSFLAPIACRGIRVPASPWHLLNIRAWPLAHAQRHLRHHDFTHC